MVDTKAGQLNAICIYIYKFNICYSCDAIKELK